MWRKDKMTVPTGISERERGHPNENCKAACVCECERIDPRKKPCKKISNYSISDKYNMKQIFVCEEHLDFAVELHFTSKHTIRIMTL